MGKFTQLDIELMNMAEDIKSIAEHYNTTESQIYEYLSSYYIALIMPIIMFDTSLTVLSLVSI